ncbi:MAG: RNA polymerase sigma factor [Bacteroidota bacterium]
MESAELIYVQKAKQGDLNAFRILVEQNKHILLSLAQAILKDRDWAEDVLQEALIKVFQKINSFKEEASFRSWLYRIVINTAYNASKKRNRYQVFKKQLGESTSVRVENKNPIQMEEQKKYIQAVLDNLKRDQALLLRLYYLCELSLAEIAEVTGFKKAKIKTDLYRGRKNFKAGLTKLLGNEINGIL